MQPVHFQVRHVRVDVFNCQQILAKISFVIFDNVIKKTNRLWFSVALMKFHWSGINWHVFNQSECRNCCLYIFIQKIAPQAKSGKYFQIWFSPDLGEKIAAFWACACKLSWTPWTPWTGSAPLECVRCHAIKSKIKNHATDKVKKLWYWRQ